MSYYARNDYLGSRLRLLKMRSSPYKSVGYIAKGKEIVRFNNAVSIESQSGKFEIGEFGNQNVPATPFEVEDEKISCTVKAMGQIKSITWAGMTFTPGITKLKSPYDNWSVEINNESEPFVRICMGKSVLSEVSSYLRFDSGSFSHVMYDSWIQPFNQKYPVHSDRPKGVNLFDDSAVRSWVGIFHNDLCDFVRTDIQQYSVEDFTYRNVANTPITVKQKNTSNQAYGLSGFAGGVNCMRADLGKKLYDAKTKVYEMPPFSICWRKGLQTSKNSTGLYFSNCISQSVPSLMHVQPFVINCEQPTGEVSDFEVETFAGETFYLETNKDQEVT